MLTQAIVNYNAPVSE
jgi:hypothetical protein